MFYFSLGLVIAILILLIFMLIRGIFFKASFKEGEKKPLTDFDFDKSIERFQTLLKIPTVSYPNREGEDLAAFEKLRAEIKTLYPLVHKNMTRYEIGETGFLFRWKGKNEGAVSVFMAHYDVVPVVEGSWSMPAFDAIIKDGILYARGSLDTKGTFCGILEACEKLLSENFTPENDIYLSFSGDEETHGNSTPQLVNYFKENNIQIAFVLDEGGAVIEPLLPGMQGRMAVIGIGEKGQMDIEFSAESQGGHASGPPQHTPVGILSRAVTRCENNPMPAKFTPPFLQMMNTIGRYGTYPVRVALANIKLLKPILAGIAKKKGGEINALIRTTTAFTKMKGSDAFNVIPSKASVGANIRYLKENTKEEIIAHYKKVIGDDRVKISVIYDSGPCPVSKTDCKEYKKLSKVIRDVWQDTVITPYLMVACSDSRHYNQISDRVYRFSAMEMTKTERKKIHGVDEGIRLEEWKNTLDFFYRIISSY